MPRRSKGEPAELSNADRYGIITSFDGEFEFLSNFYVHPFMVKSLEFPTAEHAFQAAKTLDPVWRDDIRKARTPGVAKRLGRECPLRPDWEEKKVAVMRTVLHFKFAPRTELAAKLMLTGGKHLVEGNTWGDRFWGCERDPLPHGPWVGSNHLGILLMERRRELLNDIPY